MNGLEYPPSPLHEGRRWSRAPPGSGRLSCRGSHLVCAHEPAFRLRDNLRLLSSLCLLNVPFAGSAAAHFTHDTTDVPTANVGFPSDFDFGDIDGDGD